MGEICTTYNYLIRQMYTTRAVTYQDTSTISFDNFTRTLWIKSYNFYSTPLMFLSSIEEEDKFKLLYHALNNKTPNPYVLGKTSANEFLAWLYLSV